MVRKLSDETIEKLKELHNSGKSKMEIVMETGISYWTVLYHTKDSYREKIIKRNRKYYASIAKKKKTKQGKKDE